MLGVIIPISRQGSNLLIPCLKYPDHKSPCRRTGANTSVANVCTVLEVYSNKIRKSAVGSHTAGRLDSASSHVSIDAFGANEQMPEAGHLNHGKLTEYTTNS